MKWIIALLLKLPAKKLAELTLVLLKEIVKRTKNEIDDEIVTIVETLFNRIFEKE